VFGFGVKISVVVVVGKITASACTSISIVARDVVAAAGVDVVVCQVVKLHFIELFQAIYAVHSRVQQLLDIVVDRELVG
jgi:hypothetical protein